MNEPIEIKSQTNSNGYSNLIGNNVVNQKKHFDYNLLIASIAVFLLFWACSAIRHKLLQSNAYDLGLFDQWIWLVSQGLPPYSSMEEVHILADHGAVILYLAAIPYRIISTIQWLFFSQAACLAFTSIPLWFVSRQAGLNPKQCWVACLIWWLQPVVFNTNLFDFHPEVLVMPALAGCYWASRADKPLLWFFLLLLLLSSRDGLILVVAGIGIEQFFRKRFIWGAAALALACGWLAFLNKYLYPSLTGSTTGPKAVSGLFSYLGNNLNEVLINIITKPELIINNVDWHGALIYLILLCIGIIPFVRRASLTVLLGSLPLVFINILSQEASQRTLIHHYSLPIAIIAVIAAIDGISSNKNKRIGLIPIIWITLVWTIFAKPWFFTGPYLSRINIIKDFEQAITEIEPTDKISTTSYLAPHLSQRTRISFPEAELNKSSLLDLDVILYNPLDPGWASNTEIQKKSLKVAKDSKWTCSSWSSGLEMCKRPK